jgi:D-sedoheptulose 7-phosphate isomerase
MKAESSVSNKPEALELMPSEAEIRKEIETHRSLISSATDRLATNSGELKAVSTLIVRALLSSAKIMVAGNGGSAATAQHFATECVGRFKRERDGYHVIALTADSALLTAIANDYGYEEVFARQVVAIGRPGDLLIVFSTSGESQNLIHAVSTAARRGVTTVAFTGSNPNSLAKSSSHTIMVPSSETATIQELHLMILHIICDLIETTIEGRNQTSVDTE